FSTPSRMKSSASCWQLKLRPVVSGLSTRSIKRHPVKTVKILATVGALVGLSALLPQRDVQADSTKCTIVHRVRGCDYFMVETSSDFAILEWFGGHDPDKDDVLVGDLSSYGMKDFYDETAEE